MALDFLIRLVTSGADAAKSDFKGVADSAKGVDNELSKVGDNDGLEKAGNSAKSFGDKLETVRNIGVGLAAIGGVGMVIAEGFTQAALEADTLGSKMAALLNGVGIGDAKDQVADLGLEIAKLVGGDDDEIGKAIAQAVATGRVRSLAEYGIVVDKLGQEAITAAQKISAQAGAQEALNQVIKAAGPALDQLRANSSDAALALGEMDVRWGNIEEGIGLGTSKVKAALYNGVLAPIFDIVEASPALQETGGYIFAIGSTALSAGGGILGLVAQVGMAIPALEKMGLQGVFSLSAIRTAAMSATVGLNMMTLGVTAIAVAAAATVGYVAFAFGQHMGWIDKEQTFLERLTAGWYRLTDAILSTQNVAGAQRDQNEKDLKAEIDKLKAQNQKDYDDKKITEAELNERNRKGELSLRETFAAEQRRIGDDANYVKNSEAAQRLREQGKTPAASAAPPMPAMPSAPAAPPAPPAMPVMTPAIVPVLATPKAPPLPAGVGPVASKQADPLSLAMGLAGGVFGKGSGKGGSTPGIAASGGTIQVGEPTYRQDSSGVWWFKFPDVKVSTGGFQQAAMSYRN